MVIDMELSVAQMQHINGLFARNPTATHVAITRVEYADSRHTAVKASLKVPSEAKKKGKATSNYLEEVLLTT